MWHDGVLCGNDRNCYDMSKKPRVMMKHIVSWYTTSQSLDMMSSILCRLYHFGFKDSSLLVANVDCETIGSCHKFINFLLHSTVSHRTPSLTKFPCSTYRTASQQKARQVCSGKTKSTLVLIFIFYVGAFVSMQISDWIIIHFLTESLEYPTICLQNQK